VINTGVWIASEFRKKRESRFSAMFLLCWRILSRNHGFFAIDCILLWAGPSNKSDVASVIALLDDAEAAVRWKAMDFLSRASREQLQAALSHLAVKEPQSKHVGGLQWLLGSDASNPKEVIAASSEQGFLSSVSTEWWALSECQKVILNPFSTLHPLKTTDVKDFRRFQHQAALNRADPFEDDMGRAGPDGL